MARVLVIEDDLSLSEAMQLQLELSGYDVATARDGKRGLAVLEACPIDVVVTDLMMPEMDGLDFLRAHCCAARGPRPPVLAVSALDPYLDEALALGAADVLRKPFDAEELVGKVGALLRGTPAGPPGLRPPPDTAAEQRRLELIERLGLESPDFGEPFEPFTARVATTFDVPICVVSIVDERRQHWSAACGLPPDLELARGSPRADSFCTHAVEARAPLVVQDAASSPVFAANPLVRRVPLRFYAGVPILALGGDAVGTLCLMGFQPRRFTHVELRLLCLFARRVAAEVRRRERMASPDAAAVVDEYADLVDPEMPIFARPAFVELVDIECARHIETRQSLVIALIAVAPGRWCSVIERAKAAFAAGWFGRLARMRMAMTVGGVDADAAARKLRTAVGPDGAVGAFDVSGRVAHGFDVLRDIGAL
jgi:CheY-like chemotaxis protein